MKRSNSIVLLVTSVLLAVVQSGCMTVGYSYAKDPKRVSATPITITHIQPQNIYNSAGVYWVGPFAKVESRGQEITVVEANGKSTKLVQPLSDKYELRVGQEAVCIINRGQIWVQPTDYPLPPEFDALSTKSSPLPTPYESSVTITLPQGWKKEPLPDSMKSNSAKLLFAQNVTSDCGAILSVVRRKDVADMLAYTASREEAQVNALQGAVKSPITTLTIGGQPAYRFEVTGKSNKVRLTYCGTIIFGTNEIAYLNVWTFASAFDRHREELMKLSDDVVGL